MAEDEEKVEQTEEEDPFEKLGSIFEEKSRKMLDEYFDKLAEVVPEPEEKIDERRGTGSGRGDDSESGGGARAAKARQEGARRPGALDFLYGRRGRHQA